MEAEVRATVPMELETDEALGGRVALSAAFTYAAEDPFAVTVTFYCDGDEVTRWRLDRQQLADGCRRPVGVGDVRIAPARTPFPTAGHRADVRIELRGTPGPAGRDRAVLYAAATDIGAFLAAAHAVVPPGEERVCLDDFLDSLTRVMDESGRQWARPGEHPVPPGEHAPSGEHAA